MNVSKDHQEVRVVRHGERRCQVDVRGRSGRDGAQYLRAPLGAHLGNVPVLAVNDLDAALQSRAFDAFVICTPAHTHLAIARGLDLFGEA